MAAARTKTRRTRKTTEIEYLEPSSLRKLLHHIGSSAGDDPRLLAMVPSVADFHLEQRSSFLRAKDARSGVGDNPAPELTDDDEARAAMRPFGLNFNKDCVPVPDVLRRAEQLRLELRRTRAKEGGEEKEEEEEQRGKGATHSTGERTRGGAAAAAAAGAAAAGAAAAATGGTAAVDSEPAPPTKAQVHFVSEMQGLIRQLKPYTNDARAALELLRILLEEIPPSSSSSSVSAAAASSTASSSSSSSSSSSVAAAAASPASSASPHSSDELSTPHASASSDPSTPLTLASGYYWRALDSLASHGRLADVWTVMGLMSTRGMDWQAKIVIWVRKCTNRNNRKKSDGPMRCIHAVFSAYRLTVLSHVMRNRSERALQVLGEMSQLVDACGGWTPLMRLMATRKMLRAARNTREEEKKQSRPIRALWSVADGNMGILYSQSKEHGLAFFQHMVACNAAARGQQETEKPFPLLHDTYCYAAVRTCGLEDFAGIQQSGTGATAAAAAADETGPNNPQRPWEPKISFQGMTDDLVFLDQFFQRFQRSFAARMAAAVSCYVASPACGAEDFSLPLPARTPPARPQQPSLFSVPPPVAHPPIAVSITKQQILDLAALLQPLVSASDSSSDPIPLRYTKETLDLPNFLFALNCAVKMHHYEQRQGQQQQQKPQQQQQQQQRGEKKKIDPAAFAALPRKSDLDDIEAGLHALNSRVLLTVPTYVSKWQKRLLRLLKQFVQQCHSTLQLVRDETTITTAATEHPDHKQEDDAFGEAGWNRNELSALEDLWDLLLKHLDMGPEHLDMGPRAEHNRPPLSLQMSLCAALCETAVMIEEIIELRDSSASPCFQNKVLYSSVDRCLLALDAFKNFGPAAWEQCSRLMLHQLSRPALPLASVALGIVQTNWQQEGRLVSGLYSPKLELRMRLSVKELAVICEGLAAETENRLKGDRRMGDDPAVLWEQTFLDMMSAQTMFRGEGIFKNNAVIGFHILRAAFLSERAEAAVFLWKVMPIPRDNPKLLRLAFPSFIVQGYWDFVKKEVLYLRYHERYHELIEHARGLASRRVAMASLSFYHAVLHAMSVGLLSDPKLLPEIVELALTHIPRTGLTPTDQTLGFVLEAFISSPIGAAHFLRTDQTFLKALQMAMPVAASASAAATSPLTAPRVHPLLSSRNLMLWWTVGAVSRSPEITHSFSVALAVLALLDVDVPADLRVRAVYTAFGMRQLGNTVDGLTQLWKDWAGLHDKLMSKINDKKEEKKTEEKKTDGAIDGTAGAADDSAGTTLEGRFEQTSELLSSLLEVLLSPHAERSAACRDRLLTMRMGPAKKSSSPASTSAEDDESLVGPDRLPLPYALKVLSLLQSKRESGGDLSAVSSLVTTPVPVAGRPLTSQHASFIVNYACDYMDAMVSPRSGGSAVEQSLEPLLHPNVLQRHRPRPSDMYLQGSCISKCRSDLDCANSECEWRHSTVDHRSPASGSAPIDQFCWFDRECWNKNCDKKHSTVDGRTSAKGSVHVCLLNKRCFVKECEDFHDTVDNKSPATGSQPMCRFDRRCTDKNCRESHNTSDRKSPASGSTFQTCHWNLNCTVLKCRLWHDTNDGKSPATGSTFEVCPLDLQCKDMHCKLWHSPEHPKSRSASVPKLKPCLFNLQCTNEKCWSWHDTSDGKSPASGSTFQCPWDLNCRKSACRGIHNTVDGRSPKVAKLEEERAKRELAGKSGRSAASDAVNGKSPPSPFLPEMSLCNKFPSIPVSAASLLPSTAELWAEIKAAGLAMHEWAPKCGFDLRCRNSECFRRHSTVDGKSPVTSAGTLRRVPRSQAPVMTYTHEEQDVDEVYNALCWIFEQEQKRSVASLAAYDAVTNAAASELMRLVPVVEALLLWDEAARLSPGGGSSGGVDSCCPGPEATTRFGRLLAETYTTLVQAGENKEMVLRDEVDSSSPLSLVRDVHAFVKNSRFPAADGEQSSLVRLPVVGFPSSAPPSTQSPSSSSVLQAWLESASLREAYEQRLAELEPTKQAD